MTGGERVAMSLSKGQAVGLAIVAALTTVVLVVLEAIDRRRPFHATDRGVRFLDMLRDAARM